MTKAEDLTTRGMSDGKTSVEKYLRMNEREKDLEIEKAVNRLQKRIQAILYVLDKDLPRAPQPGPEPQAGKHT